MRPTARVTTWVTLPATILRDRASREVARLTAWLRTRPNLYDPDRPGGASTFFVPVVHHALRRAGLPLPFFVVPERQREHFAWNRVAQVTLRPCWGGPVVEAAWEQISAAAGLLDEWRTTLTRAAAAVAHYIEQHSRTTLEDRLAGRLEWPPIPDSTDAREGAGDPQVIRAVDGGYLDQRIQETLLAGDPMVAGADARQHAVYLQSCSEFPNLRF